MKLLQYLRGRSVLFRRDIRVLRVAWQIVHVAAALWAVGNYLDRSQTFSFAFLDEEANFIPTDSYARAFLVGVLNTVRVVAAGIVLASLLGLVAGAASILEMRRGGLSSE